MKRHDKGLACHGHAAMGNMPWTGMTVTLSLKGGGHETVCQPEHWTPKGVDWEGPTSIGGGNKCQQGL